MGIKSTMNFGFQKEVRVLGRKNDSFQMGAEFSLGSLSFLVPCSTCLLQRGWTSCKMILGVANWRDYWEGANVKHKNV